MSLRNGKIVVIVGMLAGVALLSSCSFGATVGSGKVATETRTLSDVTEVEFAFVGDMTVTQGDEESLTITGDDNIVPLIKSDVTGGVLKIHAPGVTVARSVTPLRYELKVRDLRRLALTGLGNIAAPTLAADSFAAEVSGAGTLRVDNLAADALDLSLTGLGNANVAGAVDRQAVSLSGAGSISYKGEPQVTQQISGVGSISAMDQ